MTHVVECANLGIRLRILNVDVRKLHIFYEPCRGSAASKIEFLLLRAVL